MPRERTPARKPAGPGRPERRPRTGARSASATTAAGQRQPQAPDAAPAAAGKPPRPARRLPRRVTAFRLTRRAIFLFSVLALLALSYVGSLRVLLVQQADLATAQQQIAERSVRVAELEDDLERWRDPAYLKTQARTRLGWVMPGEVGYRVIGRDGQILSGDSEIEGIGTHTASQYDPRWWDRLGGSVEAADDPDPVQP